MISSTSSYRLFLVFASLSLLVGCQTWDLPTRKTQRQCTTPGGQFSGFSARELVATLTITQPTGTTTGVNWDFGDGKTESTNGLSVTHTFPAKGTYTVKATMTNLCEQTTTLTRSITVTDVVPPTVTVQDATEITKTSANLRMTVTSNGKGTISEYGVYYSKTNATPTIADSKASVTASVGVGTLTSFPVTGLEPRVTYYVRAYARNEANPAPGEPSYSEVRQFRTLYDPILTTPTTLTVSRTNATVGFTVADAGNPVITQYGIAYSATNAMPSVDNSPFVNVTTSVVGSNVPVSLSGLTIDQTYTYRSFSRNADNKVTYGPPGTFSTVDITTDLIVNVPFNNQSLTDLSGNNNNATLVGGPGYTTDRKNNPNSAIQLNGNGQYFYFIDNAALRPEALTVSFWINARAINGAMQLYNKSRFADSYGEQYSSKIVPAASGPSVTITNDVKQGSNCIAAKGWQTFTSTSSFAIVNTWNHVVFTYEGRTARMYLNGVIISERTDLPQSNMDNCAGGDLKFGAQIKDFPQYFNGTMDDVRVYRRALTGTQVEALKAL